MTRRLAQLLRAVKARWFGISIAAAALTISAAFLAIVLRHTSFGLPIEDAYIYLTYAKQFGRAEPFTYFPGGGYSAGSTSVIWPMLLAPFWTLGARGETLVWISFFSCACLYAATGVLCGLVVRRLYGTVTGLVAAGLAIGVAPFAFTALSGMEVALASTLLVAATYQLLSVEPSGPPTKLLAVTLACLSLSRPEATVIVAGIIAVQVTQRLRQKDLRAAAWWAVPMLPPLLWIVANRTFAGHWFPNTGVAKSHFYLPGFDWTYWWEAVVEQTKAMVRGLFWSPDSPLVWPRAIALLWLVGAVRVLVWAFKSKKLLAGALFVFAPLALVVAVIASSGAWKFHNYRYISPAFPLLMATAACGIAPFRLPERIHWSQHVHRAWSVACLVLLLWFGRAAYAPMRADMELYAQNVVDLNGQVVRLGRYIRDHLPTAYIMFHDAGAIAYYGDRPVYDMLGLVTNHQAHVANNGPGSRFEFLESLRPEERPTHFAYYPGWMGQAEFFGEVLVRTPLRRAFHPRRLIGDYDMQLIVADWSRVHTAERPQTIEPGWNLVDRIDVADVRSEQAHQWSGRLGRRRFGDPTARWSVFHKEVGGPQLLLDGGRTIRGGSERFVAKVDPAKPVRVVLRTGGQRAYPFHESIVEPNELRLLGKDGTELGRAVLPAPDGRFVEVAFDVRADSATLELRTKANGPYRVFHWFVLQPM